MDTREYLRVVQVGKTFELIEAISFYTDFPLQIGQLDKKVLARKATKPSTQENKDPIFWFGPKWFTKLNQFPAVSIEVRESRSQIRKTCYGFREYLTGERVYLRIEPGGIAEFRDSPSGYLLGTKYLIPNINRIRGDKRWDKVSRLLTRLLTKKGIMVTDSMVRKYQRTLKRRVKLANRLVDMRTEYMPRKLRTDRRKRRAKAKQQI